MLHTHALTPTLFLGDDAGFQVTRHPDRASEQDVSIRVLGGTGTAQVIYAEDVSLRLLRGHLDTLLGPDDDEVRVTIRTAGAAFTDETVADEPDHVHHDGARAQEVARILRVLADRIEHYDGTLVGGTVIQATDLNGNNVGSLRAGGVA